MYITVKQLIEAIESSKVELKFLVESENYYARRGDTTEKSIEIIDSSILIHSLLELIGVN